MSPLFLSLIRERQIHRHIYREKHRESDNIERNKYLIYIYAYVFRSRKCLIRRPLPHKGKMRWRKTRKLSKLYPRWTGTIMAMLRWIWGWRRSTDRTRGLHRRSVAGSSWSTSVPWKRKTFKVGVWSGLRSESNSGKDLLASIKYTFSTTAHTELPNCMVHVGASDRKRWSPTPTCKRNRRRTWREWKL